MLFVVDLSLGRLDRDAAKRKPEELATALGANGQLDGATLTIGLLFGSYETHGTPTKGEGARKHDHEDPSRSSTHPEV